MLKIHFTNAQVEDEGYGLHVNGKRLESLISTALGTRVGDRYGYNSGLHSFNSKCCDVSVIITPKPVTELIKFTDGTWYHSVESLEEDKREQFSKKTETAES